MKLLILGGSNSQLNAIKRAKEKGHTVIVSDYLKNAPGKEIADFCEEVSTFDVEGNIQIGKKYGIDGVITLGTDQPVYTAAKVAEAIGLPSFIDANTAKAVTNKKVMKKKFTEQHIPTVKYTLLKENFKDHELEDFTFPVVVKPLDSQGQRGVYKLHSMEDIRSVFQDVLSFSREKVIIVEEFYESDEITVNGWVVNGVVYVFSIVDRISHNYYPHIGVCIKHRSPSIYMKEYYHELISLTNQIVHSFHIKNGPIYFQILVGKEGLKINEIACRIGGAYEDLYIHKATGIDILDMLVDYSVGLEISDADLKKFDLYHTKKHFSVEMFFAEPCSIHSLNDMETIKMLPGILQAQHNFKPGDQIREMTNATQRAGYMIIEGDNEKELNQNIKRAYEKLAIYDEYFNNRIIRFDIL